MSMMSNCAELFPTKRSFLEFDLDEETMTVVEELAAAEKVTPFEMCVTLLREAVAGVGGGKSKE